MFGARRAACSVFWARTPRLVAVVVIDVDRAVGVERRDTARPVVGALVEARLDFIADLELAALVGIVGRTLPKTRPYATGFPSIVVCRREGKLCGVKCCLSARRKIVRCFGEGVAPSRGVWASHHPPRSTCRRACRPRGSRPARTSGSADERARKCGVRVLDLGEGTEGTKGTRRAIRRRVRRSGTERAEETRHATRRRAHGAFGGATTSTTIAT